MYKNPQRKQHHLCLSFSNRIIIFLPSFSCIKQCFWKCLRPELNYHWFIFIFIEKKELFLASKQNKNLILIQKLRSNLSVRLSHGFVLNKRKHVTNSEFIMLLTRFCKKPMQIFWFAYIKLNSFKFSYTIT